MEENERMGRLENLLSFAPSLSDWACLGAAGGRAAASAEMESAGAAGSRT